MADGVLSIRLSRPPEEVFPLVANLERAPEWVPDLVEVTKQTPGEVKPGTRYTELVRMGNNMASGELEVMEYDPPSTFVHKGKSGPSRFVARFTLEADGDGTLLTHHYTVRLSGLFKLLDPFVGGWVRRNAMAAMVNLRRAVDG